MQTIVARPRCGATLGRDQCEASSFSPCFPPSHSLSRTPARSPATAISPTPKSQPALPASSLCLSHQLSLPHPPPNSLRSSTPRNPSSTAVSSPLISLPATTTSASATPVTSPPTTSSPPMTCFNPLRTSAGASSKPSPPLPSPPTSPAPSPSPSVAALPSPALSATTMALPSPTSRSSPSAAHPPGCGPRSHGLLATTACSKMAVPMTSATSASEDLLLASTPSMSPAG